MARNLLTPDSCALALIDHQQQMFSATRSRERILALHNVQILAKSAKLFNVPLVLTTMVSDAFSGNLLPIVEAVLPQHEVIERRSMDSWQEADFRKAIEATGKKKIVIAGLGTEACVAYPTVQMLAEGYEVYVSTDACCDITEKAHERAVQRMLQAGAVPIRSLQFLCELFMGKSRQSQGNRSHGQEGP